MFVAEEVARENCLDAEISAPYLFSASVLGMQDRARTSLSRRHLQLHPFPSPTILFSDPLQRVAHYSNGWQEEARTPRC
jgi:hypothetical protein